MTLVDPFADILGSRRGDTHIDVRNTPLIARAASGVDRAKSLVEQIEAGQYMQSMDLLRDVGPINYEEEKGYCSWPLEEVAARQKSRDGQRSWSSNVPNDLDAELDHDAIDLVRRTLVDKIAAETQRAWEPLLREVSHCIGVRLPVAEHVIEIDGVMHLWEVNDIFLMGSSAHMQSCLCKESARRPGQEGRAKPVKRGRWKQVMEMDRDERESLYCKKCASQSGAHYISADRTESRDYTPLDEKTWRQILYPSFLYMYLANTTEPTLEGLQKVANERIRSSYMRYAQERAERSDKPCKWYRSKALTDDERWEVRRLTNDNRIGRPVEKILDKLITDTPDFTPSEDWYRQWAVDLCALLQKRDKENLPY